MPWNPRDSTRKVQMFQIFVQHSELTPAEYAGLVGMRPLSAAYAYLRRHWSRGLLHRHRDWRGRLIYSIAPNGAKYLLWWKQQFPDAKVGL
jgi:hypothetical protein